MSKAILEMHEFTESEMMSLQILSTPFLNFLKTQLAIESMRAINIRPPVGQEGYMQFIQEKAEIDGAIGVYNFLINNHEETVKKLAV